MQSTHNFTSHFTTKYGSMGPLLQLTNYSFSLTASSPFGQYQIILPDNTETCKLIAKKKWSHKSEMAHSRTHYIAHITLSFLSCRAYGKHGITAVTRDDDAILQALIIMRSSIIMSFISPQPLWMMNTSSPRTDSPISTLHQCTHTIHHFNNTSDNKQT